MNSILQLHKHLPITEVFKTSKWTVCVFFPEFSLNRHSFHSNKFPPWATKDIVASLICWATKKQDIPNHRALLTLRVCPKRFHIFGKNKRDRKSESVSQKGSNFFLHLSDRLIIGQEQTPAAQLHPLLPNHINYTLPPIFFNNVKAFF